jgi:hypothetical protein
MIAELVRRPGVVHANLFELAGEPWWFVGKDLGDGDIRRAPG